MFRKLCSAILFGFGAFCANAAGAAAEDVYIDGNWWQHLNGFEKVVAVETMADATPSMFGFGFSYAQGVAGGITPGAEKDGIWSKVPQPKFDRTLGVYITGIDGWYARHPMLVRTPVSNVFFCLNDDKLGDDCETMAVALTQTLAETNAPQRYMR